MLFSHLLRRARLPPWVRLLVAVTAVRTLAAALLPIVAEEAYHWNFARHPDIGYFDHPPMIAWSIAGGRLLFGDTPLGVRAGPLAWSVGMFIILARMAARRYGERAAVWAVGLLSLTPLAFIASAVGFPDAPLLFFWSLALSLSDRAIESRRGAWWLAAGAALGGGLLSKYTAVFLPLSMLGYLLASRRDRFWLRGPWPYLGILVAIGVFSPVLLWNGRHDWASFRFQSVERFADMGVPSLSTLRYFLMHQIICVFPFTLPLAWGTCRRGLRQAALREQLLLWSCLPTLGFFLLVSLWRNTNYLWVLPAYLGLVVAMAGAVTSDAGRVAGFYRRNWRPLAAGVCGFALAVALHVKYILPFLPPLRELYGWEDAAHMARKLRSTLPEGAFYLGLGRKYVGTSLLAFHLREPSAVHGRPLLGLRGLQYDFWDRPEDFEGRDAVVVLGDEFRAGELLREAIPHFQTLEPVGRVVVGFGRHRIVEAPDMVFSIYRGRGYRPRELPRPESPPPDLPTPSAH